MTSFKITVNPVKRNYHFLVNLVTDVLKESGIKKQLSKSRDISL